ncbi:NAD(P)H-binding protein [Nonomuraea thailandensis]
MSFIVTTGATGRLGGRVAALLAAAGAEQRLVSRHAGRAPRLDRATAAAASYGDREAMGQALDGASTVLFVSASESADRLGQHRTFVDAARDARVSHLVYVSFYGAAPEATFTLARDHWATEQYIRDSGLTFTFLRDNLYADFLPGMAGNDGVIRGRPGRGGWRPWRRTTSRWRRPTCCWRRRSTKGSPTT